MLAAWSFDGHELEEALWDWDLSGGAKPVQDVGDFFVLQPGFAEFALLEVSREVLLEKCLTACRGRGRAGRGKEVEGGHRNTRPVNGVVDLDVSIRDVQGLAASPASQDFVKSCAAESIVAGALRRACERQRIGGASLSDGCKALVEGFPCGVIHVARLLGEREDECPNVVGEEEVQAIAA